MHSLYKLFCQIDDFCQIFELQWQQQLLSNGIQQRQRPRRMCMSEVMTILIMFHRQQYRNFKQFYLKHVCVYWRKYFPGIVSYNRFVEWMKDALLPLCAYLRYCFGACSGISFIDSTSIKVCHNRRINSHKVFDGLAQRSKTSTGWFFGFRLHLVVNDQGELLNFTLTPGNVDDRRPVFDLLKRLFGKVFADRGYVSAKLAAQLKLALGIDFFAKLRRNMHNQLMTLTDKLLARKRCIIESIFDQLKNISQIEHTRHRSPVNFLVNLVCGLIAYCHQPKKPSLNLNYALV